MLKNNTPGGGLNRKVVSGSTMGRRTVVCSLLKPKVFWFRDGCKVVFGGSCQDKTSDLASFNALNKNS